MTVQAGGSGIHEGACDDCEYRDECDDKMPDDTAALVRISAPEGNLFFEQGEDGIALYCIGSQNTVALRKALEFAVQALKDAEDGESEAYVSGYSDDAQDSDQDDDQDGETDDAQDDDETDADDDIDDIIGEPLEGESPEEWLLRVIFCGGCTKCHGRSTHHRKNDSQEDPTHGYAD